MNAGELYEWLGENTYPEQEITLEVGGDGAIHPGNLEVAIKKGLDEPVVLSSEAP